ncbi:MAG: hypothetical protein KDJ22_12020 [Candidatus Competibacteraceae bacterium]|nr:hypothetical protein [Candidatus Competibacteraceae bacterium]HRX63146.1 hypothetical protein [Candidatus Competibacter sp.]
MSLRTLLLERLKLQSPAQFEEVLFHFETLYSGLRGQIGSSDGVSQRAIQLIRFLEQNPDGLGQLGKQLDEPFTVPCAAIGELESLLQRAAIPEETVHRVFEAYLDTLGEQARLAPPDYTVQPLTDNLIAYLVDPNWMQSSRQRHLIQFINRLAPHASQPFALQNWVHKTAQGVGIPTPPRLDEPIEPQDETQSYLLLAISPEAGYYTLHAWFTSNASEPEKIETKKLGFTFDAMPQYLREILTDPRVKGRVLAGRPPVLEFFLPVHLLNLDLDQWQPPGEVSPLSTQYCLVVRAWERFGEQCWLAAWGRNWRRFQPALAELAGRRHTAWLTCPDDQCSAHFDGGRWVFSLCFVPDVEYFKSLLDSGVGILFWPRWEMDHSQYKAFKRQVASQTIQSLPEWLRQWRLRNWEKTRQTAGPFSLLWDDPRRLPKDSPTQFHPDYRG